MVSNTIVQLELDGDDPRVEVQVSPYRVAGRVYFCDADDEPQLTVHVASPAVARSVAAAFEQLATALDARDHAAELLPADTATFPAAGSSAAGTVGEPEQLLLPVTA